MNLINKYLNKLKYSRIYIFKGLNAIGVTTFHNNYRHIINTGETMIKIKQIDCFGCNYLERKPFEKCPCNYKPSLLYCERSGCRIYDCEIIAEKIIDSEHRQKMITGYTPEGKSNTSHMPIFNINEIVTVSAKYTGCHRCIGHCPNDWKYKAVFREGSSEYSLSCWYILEDV